jgi:type I restriction enzyme, S subunit
MILETRSVVEGELKSSKYQFSSDHVLYGKLRPYLAKIAAPNFAGVCSTDIIPILPGPELDRTYLLFYLRQDSMVGYATARSSGANLPRLSPNQLSDFEIPLPPLAEQKRIAAILDAADALRAKRRQTLAELDTLLQSTFLDMFGDPVTNPKGWEVVPLINLLEERSINGAYYSKEAYSTNGGTRMVHMADAFYGTVDVADVQRVSVPETDIEKYGLRSTDILVSRRSLNYEGSAKPCLIPDSNEPLIFESSLIRVRPDRARIVHLYLYHYLQNGRARSKFVFPLVTRSTISGINQANLMKVKVVTPPLSLQHCFSTIVNSVEQQKTRLRAHLAELDTLFASLQSRAFTGEL